MQNPISAQKAPQFTLNNQHVKSEDVKKRNPANTINGLKTDEVKKDEPKGWTFSAHLNPEKTDKNMNKMMNQTANEQIKFAQTILLQQLKHQFPGNEFDASKMVESLMGMMQIAQNSQLNETQQKNLDLSVSMMNHQIGALLGKTVEHRSDEFEFNNKPQRLSYSLSEPAYKTYVTIYSKNGNYPIDRKEVSSDLGQHLFEWDGSLENGQKAMPGTYRIFVETQYQAGSPPQKIDTFLHKEITDIDYSQGALGVPYSGRFPIMNFNRMVNQPTFPQSNVLNQVVTHTPLFNVVSEEKNPTIEYMI